MEHNHFVGRYLAAFIVSFGVWLALTGTLEWEEIPAGLVISTLAAALGWKRFSQVGLSALTPKKVIFFLLYIPVFFWEMIKANFDVAYRVIHPRMPIRPGVVRIKTGLKSDAGKFALANSITLTPGTLTMDVRGEDLLIHWINVRSPETEAATEMIGSRFERFLRRVFS